MTAISAGTKLYPIPGTLITLRITQESKFPIPQGTIQQCLTTVWSFAHEQPKNTILETVYRKQCSFSGLQFGIMPGIFHPELTWEDVMGIAYGLGQYFQKEQTCMATYFYITAGGRGSIGEGYIDITNTAAVKTVSELGQNDGEIAAS